jgi:hypothetical protein
VRIADHEFGLGERKINENSNKLLSLTGFAFGFAKTYNMGKTY